MGNPTRFPNGISTAKLNTNLGNLPVPDPTEVFGDFNDFITYAAGDWTVTATTGTSALQAGAGGQILQTSAATASDIQHNLRNPGNFSFTSANQVWGYFRFQLADATGPALIMGLQAGGTAFAPTDGLYFTKAAGATTVTMNIRKSSTSTTITNIATLANSTFVELGYYYNGKDTVYVFVNETLVAATTTLTNLPTATTLALGFGVQQGGTGAKTMVTDFVYASTDGSR